MGTAFYGKLFGNVKKETICGSFEHNMHIILPTKPLNQHIKESSQKGVAVQNCRSIFKQDKFNNTGLAIFELGQLKIFDFSV